MTKDQSSKTILIIVAIILGILLIGGIIFGLSCYYLYKVGTKEEKTAIPTQSTENWKSYQNSRFGFSLKYPPAFIASESQNGDGITLTTNDPPMTIMAYGSNNALSQGLDEYLNWVRDNLFKEQEAAEEILAEEIPLGKDGIPAQERQWTYKNPIDGSLTLRDQVTVLKNDTFYSVEMVIADSDYDEYP